jgi:hypothetical protein
VKFIQSLPVRLAFLGLLLLSGFVALRRVGDVAAHPVEGILVLVTTFPFYLICSFLILRGFTPDRRLLPLIVVFAFSFRFFLMPLLPSLSTDAYRYRWEGRVQLAGSHPYLAAPQEEAWEALRDATYPLIAGKADRFGYGPLWCWMEAATARAAGWITPDPWHQTILFKIPGALGDVLVLLLLPWVLRGFGLPPERMLLYAWCPLPVVEVWHSGHNDSWVALSLVLALGCAARRRWPAAVGALVIGGMVKLWPLFLIPAILTRARSVKALAGFALAVPFLPQLWLLRERADFMTGFLGGWRNNDSLFGAILWAFDGDPMRAKTASLALIALFALAAAVPRTSVDRAFFGFIAAMLLISANVHPWYLTWLACLLPLVPSLPAMMWMGLAPLSYSVLIAHAALGEWRGSTEWRWWIYLPVFAFALLGRTIATARNRKEALPAWKRT